MARLNTGVTNAKRLSQLRDAAERIKSEESCISSFFAQRLAENQELSMRNDLLDALFHENAIRAADKAAIVQQIATIIQEQEDELQHLAAIYSEIKRKLSDVHYSSPPSVPLFPSLDSYDCQVNLTLISDLFAEGWEVVFRNVFSSVGPNGSREAQWEVAVVAVVGLYDKGKTFVLNALAASNLPCGKTSPTRGLSFKQVDVDFGTKLILLDTAGTHAPIPVISSAREREDTEKLQRALVWDLADYLICVVDDFTSMDQRLLLSFTADFQQPTKKSFRDVIVVHNLRDVRVVDEFHYVWRRQIGKISERSKVVQTQVAALNPDSGEYEEREITWLKTQSSRHLCIGNADSEVGKAVNPWAFSLLRYWIKAAFVPFDRRKSLVQEIIDLSAEKLSIFYQIPIELNLTQSGHSANPRIRCRNIPNLQGFLRESVDSQLIFPRPDSFSPAVDIVQAQEYVITVELPGVREEDVELCREKVVTTVKGARKETESGKFCRRERKFGEFLLKFHIPEQYERKWRKATLSDGVLSLHYTRDYS